MIEVTRAQFKSDPLLNELHQMILDRHRPAPHTIQILQENKHIKRILRSSSAFYKHGR